MGNWNQSLRDRGTQADSNQRLQSPLPSSNLHNQFSSQTEPSGRFLKSNNAVPNNTGQGAVNNQLGNRNNGSFGNAGLNNGQQSPNTMNRGQASPGQRTPQDNGSSLPRTQFGQGNQGGALPSTSNNFLDDQKRREQQRQEIKQSADRMARQMNPQIDMRSILQETTLNTGSSYYGSGPVGSRERLTNIDNSGSNNPEGQKPKANNAGNRNPSGSQPTDDNLNNSTTSSNKYELYYMAAVILLLATNLVLGYVIYTTRQQYRDLADDLQDRFFRET